jgi:hypothetical protein
MWNQRTIYLRTEPGFDPTQIGIRVSLARKRIHRIILSIGRQALSLGMVHGQFLR